MHIPPSILFLRNYLLLVSRYVYDLSLRHNAEEFFYNRINGDPIREKDLRAAPRREGIDHVTGNDTAINAVRASA